MSTLTGWKCTKQVKLNRRVAGLLGRRPVGICIIVRLELSPRTQVSAV